VQKVLNHADIKTTARYAHVLDDELRGALETGRAAKSPEVGSEIRRVRRDKSLEGV
jgi:hypothetical protein